MPLTTSLTRDFFLTAADCNAQFELPLAQLVQTIVEVATDHANELGIGYLRMQEDGNAWVLLRLSIEMERPPRVHEHYSFTTWVESFNRRFSERDFELSVWEDGQEPRVIGHARTVWTVINSTTRQAATLDGLTGLESVVSPRRYEMPKAPRVRPADFEDARRRRYDVVFSDIDTNRHLTSKRYIELMLDMWPLEHFDSYVVNRFEIAYSNEARPADQLEIDRIDIEGDLAACRITRGAENISSATLHFAPRM